jgi:hypothetical protein
MAHAIDSAMVPAQAGVGNRGAADARWASKAGTLSRDRRCLVNSFRTSLPFPEKYGGFPRSQAPTVNEETLSRLLENGEKPSWPGALEVMTQSRKPRARI